MRTRCSAYLLFYTKLVKTAGIGNVWLTEMQYTALGKFPKFDCRNNGLFFWIPSYLYLGDWKDSYLEISIYYICYNRGYWITTSEPIATFSNVCVAICWFFVLWINVNYVSPIKFICFAGTIARSRRLTRLLKATTGKVVYGGSFNTLEKFITPTIITKIDKHDVCMEEEVCFRSKFIK